MWGSSVFLGVTHVPRPNGAGLQRLLVFATSYVRALSARNDNQIVRGYQTSCEDNFTGQPRMLTRDLFAVANILVFFCVFCLFFAMDSLNVFRYLLSFPRVLFLVVLV